MRGRTVWFVAGTAAGVYATAKARRAAYRLSMPGLVDQAAAVGLGWRAFAGELRNGMTQYEREVAARLDAVHISGPEPRTPAGVTRPTESDAP
jgi:hypothetical protein